MHGPSLHPCVFRVDTTDDGILGYVTKHHCVINSPEISKSEFYKPQVDLMNTPKKLGEVYEAGLYNILCFPLLQGDTVFDPTDVLDGVSFLDPLSI